MTLGLAKTSIFNREEIVATNAWLESLPPAEQPIELLKWADKTLAPGSWVQFTSFGCARVKNSFLVRFTFAVSFPPAISNKVHTCATAL